MRRKAIIFLAACLVSGAAAALPFAVGANLGPLLSIMHPDVEAEAIDAFVFATGESALPYPGPGFAAGIFAELTLFPIFSLGTEVDYTLRAAYCLGSGVESDGDWWRIQSNTIGFTLYSKFSFLKVAAGSLQVDGGFYIGFLPSSADVRQVVSGYTIDLEGDANERNFLFGARAGADWEWSLGTSSPFVLRTGLRFEYLFLKVRDPGEPYPLPISAALRASFAYVDRGKKKSAMIPAKEAGLLP